MAMYSYPLILKELLGGRVCVNFPDIEGLNFESDSIGKACERAKEELKNYIINTINDYKKLPKSTPLSCLKMSINEFVILIDIEI